MFAPWVLGDLVSRVRRRGQQRRGVDVVHKAALSDVTVGETGERCGEPVPDDIRVTQSEHVHRRVHVAELRSASREAGSFRRDQTNPDGDVVAVVVVFEIQFGTLTVRNRQSETLAGRLSPLTSPCDRVRVTLQARLHGPRELWRAGRNCRADRSRGGNG